MQYISKSDAVRQHQLKKHALLLNHSNSRLLQW